MRASVDQFGGTALSGPTTSPVGDIGLDASARVELTWMALERVPATKLHPVDTQSQLTFSPVNSESILPTGMITRAAQFGADRDAREFRESISGGAFGKTSIVSRRSGLVAPGTTIRFDLADPIWDGAPNRRIAISISRRLIDRAQPAGAAAQTELATIAIRIDDYLRPRSESGPTRYERPAFGQETALLEDVPLPDGATFALLVPMRFEGTPWRAITALIDVHTAGISDQKALVELQENINESLKAARAATSQPAAIEGADLPSAVAALGSSGGLRSPLLFLATETDAAIASDFVLVADDAMLEMLADQTRHFASSQDRSRWAKSLGWQMDRSSLRLMTQSAARPNAPPGITALLGLYAGEAGRHAESLQEILQSARDREDLDLRLVAENFIYLEDNSPSARVRAFDWLKSKNKAPPGFDPLGTPKARRAAMDNALNAMGGAP